LILVVTNRDDLTADWLILELEERQTLFVRFNTEDYPESAGLTWTPEGAHFTLSTGQVDLAQVDAIWFRRPVLPRVSGEGERAVWAAREAREALDGVWRTYPGRFVNRPECNQRASVKPEQLVRAARLGFTVPETLVTNEPDEAVAFLAAHPRAVAKPLFSGRVPDGDSEGLFFTTLLDDAARTAAASLGPEPYLFQDFVDKEYDVRVTVIGDQVFAARIDSQTSDEARVDWRKGAQASAHSVERLPDEVNERCLALLREYGLSFGAIDLAAVDGDYVFFEINPNGQWAWVEQLTGLPLRAAMADLLSA
jgi:hypothetical protein